MQAEELYEKLNHELNEILFSEKVEEWSEDSTNSLFQRILTLEAHLLGKNNRREPTISSLI